MSVSKPVTISKQIRIYQPTYQLNPRKRFNIEVVEKTVQRIVASELEEVEYSEKSIPDLCLSLAESIKSAIKEENYDRACNEDEESIRLCVCRKRMEPFGLGYFQPEEYGAFNLKAVIRLVVQWVYEAIQNVGNPYVQKIEEGRREYYSYWRQAPPYRIIVAVTIGQRRQQSVHIFHSFLWDHERDCYVSYNFENCHIFANVVVYGVYFD